eukprot:CCRYP_010025-RA/>CCRYP_010025-RA protein AED:0.43 eAED:-0.72 QI:0/0/0/0.5/1/1/2/0/548
MSEDGPIDNDQGANQCDETQEEGAAGENVACGVNVDMNQERPVEDEGQPAVDSCAQVVQVRTEGPSSANAATDEASGDQAFSNDTVPPQSTSMPTTEPEDMQLDSDVAVADSAGSADNVARDQKNTHEEGAVSGFHASAPGGDREGAPDKLPQSAPVLDTPSPIESKETTAAVTSSTASDAVQILSDSTSSGAVVMPETNKSESNTGKSNSLPRVVPLQSNHQNTTSTGTATATTSSHDKSTNVSAHRPSWYDQSNASDFERRSLPEWFDGSAPHRTPAAYIRTREQILDLAKKNEHQYITATALRRSVTGDSGSLLRLHAFLNDWSFINAGLVGESAPAEVDLLGVRSSWNNDGKSAKRKFSDIQRSILWTPSRLQALEACVLSCLSKKSGKDGTVEVVVDWDAVCSKMGGGVTAHECQYIFLQPPKKGSPSMPPTNDNASAQVRPDVLKRVIDASLSATQNIDEAKKASLIGAVASVAAEKAEKEEHEIRRTLMDIIDQRVQRLENRIALLDDVEALLEAERVALELERRDMYTARCRQWFGDGSS